MNFLTFRPRRFTWKLLANWAVHFSVTKCPSGVWTYPITEISRSMGKTGLQYGYLWLSLLYSTLFCTTIFLLEFSGFCFTIRITSWILLLRAWSFDISFRLFSTELSAPRFIATAIIHLGLKSSLVSLSNKNAGFPLIVSARNYQLPWRVVYEDYIPVSA